MFLRKIAQRTALMGWLIAALSITSVPQANAAQTTFYSALGSAGCVNAYSANLLNAQKLIATSSFTVNTIKVLIGGGAQTNFLTSRWHIFSHNPNGGSGTPGGPDANPLATFTPDAISGTGVNTIASYKGSYTVTSGTSYWISAGQWGSSFPLCYLSSVTTADLAMTGFIVDTSTSASNTAWLRVNSSSTSATGASWTTLLPQGLAWQISLENITATPVTASLATQSGSLKTDFRTVTPLTVNVDTQSKVTYYANGKVIAGCRNILSSTGIATCNWKPSVHGSYRIYAYANPVSTSYTATTTSVINIGVGARTNTR